MDRQQAVSLQPTMRYIVSSLPGSHGLNTRLPTQLLLLDHETLEDLAVLDAARPGLVIELARKFETARALQLEQLRASLAAGDSAAAALLLHSLRGGAAALGMQALADAFDRLEARLPAGVERVDELSQLMLQSVAALRAQFSDPPTLLP